MSLRLAILIFSLYGISCFAGSTTSVQFTGNLQSFKYTEWTDAGAFFDSETGWMPGFGLFAESFLGNKLVAFGTFDYFQGTTRYDGALNDTPPTPIVSTTNNTMVDVSFALGRIFSAPEGRLIPYAGIGGRYWRRGLTGQGAYLEKYYFLYLPVGARYEKALSEKIQVAADFSLFWNVGGRISIIMTQLDPNIVDSTGTLGSDFGLKLELPIQYHLTPNLNLVAAAFFHHFGIGKGDPFRIYYKNGTEHADSPFLEPQSTTFIYGIRLGASWIF